MDYIAVESRLVAPLKPEDAARSFPVGGKVKARIAASDVILAVN